MREAQQIGRADPRLGAVYRGFADGPDSGLVLPATAEVVVIVKLEDSPLRPPEFVTGARGAPLRIEGACAPAYVEISLPPLRAYELLGLPMDELDGQIVELTDLVGEGGRELADRVRAAPSWVRRFAVLDEFLLRRLESGPAVAPEVKTAWHRLVSTGGRIAIGQLAAEVGWSHKHLISRFRRQVGLSPKIAARLIRLDRARRAAARPGARWDRVAADTGYADQSHLIRDFRTFTGTSPTGGR